MKRTLRRRFCSTAIGSLPYTDPKAACEKIFRDFKDIPFWPQLPRLSFFESMYAQYIEGFPAVRIDEDKNRIWIETSGDLISEVEKAYHKILEEDLDYFAITEKHAAGFYEFLRQAKGADLTKASFLKGHITGHISFGLSVTDENKQSILYKLELAEALTKILALKARFQIRKLKEISDNIIIFIDEPYLVSIGSSVVNINQESAKESIREVVDAIHAEGALCGIHCCGNTDWPFLMGLDIDILNFDAYNFAKSISLYPESLKDFLNKDKYLAWGIVPTSEDIVAESIDSLIKRLESSFGYMEDKGIRRNLILDSLMITPSCGCGTLDEEKTDRVLQLNAKLPERLRKVYGK